MGAPVRLNGVDIGNVMSMRVVSDKDKQLTPVEVVMKVSTKYHASLREDSLTALSTAGVLGETYIDIDSSQAVGPEVKDGDVLPIRDRPDLNDMIRSSQGTLQNMDALLRRLDRIVAFVESGKGSVGKLIYDPTLYNRITDTVNEFQTIANDISKGKGTVGKLLADDTVYNKLNATMDKVNLIVDDINAGKGTAGKFLKDPALFNNANAAIANLKQVTDDINAGKGTLGKLAKDQEMANKIQDTVNKLQAIADAHQLRPGNDWEADPGSVRVQQSRPGAGGEPGTGQVRARESEEVSDDSLAGFLSARRNQIHSPLRARRKTLFTRDVFPRFSNLGAARGFV